MKQENEKLVRIKSIVGPNGVLPISKSSWWAGVKSGRYPKPIKLGPNTTCWRWSEINQLMEKGII